jgi:hypothetical protein
VNDLRLLREPSEVGLPSCDLLGVVGQFVLDTLASELVGPLVRALLPQMLGVFD